jgi:hypothetical protein
VPQWEASQAGPFHNWPTGDVKGFDYYYGFIGDDTSQWQPNNLFRNTTPIEPYLGHPGWNLITAMADEAIAHVKMLNEVQPDRPFLIYYAPGGTHSPHHPTKAWVDEITAMHLFDEGWNKQRERIFANQKKLGVIPKNAKLTAWPDDLPKWDTLSAEEKKLYIRQADVYAAYLTYTDHEIGRVIQAVEDAGKLDNTLIIYISAMRRVRGSRPPPSRISAADTRAPRSRGRPAGGCRACAAGQTRPGRRLLARSFPLRAPALGGRGSARAEVSWRFSPHGVVQVHRCGHASSIPGRAAACPSLARQRGGPGAQPPECPAPGPPGGPFASNPRAPPDVEELVGTPGWTRPPDRDPRPERSSQRHARSHFGIVRPADTRVDSTTPGLPTRAEGCIEGPDRRSRRIATGRRLEGATARHRLPSPEWDGARPVRRAKSPPCSAVGKGKTGPQGPGEE